MQPRLLRPGGASPLLTKASRKRAVKGGDLIGHTVLGRLQPLAAAGIVPGREWTELGDGTIDPFQGIRACCTVPVKIPGR